MIKGVNKQVLEVTNPESPYFDKIIFFVSADGSAQSEEKLKNEAQSVASQLKKPPKSRRSKRDKFLSIMFAVCGIGAGAVLMLVLSSIVQGV